MNETSSQLFPKDRINFGIRGLTKRENAEQNMLLLLVGFAGAIILTREFLEFTGYPQIASGDFHIAHVLWGGLLLFVASVLLLIWRDSRLYWLSSLLAGVGFGLFIDEVGKFITTTNDYFYPLAAPIIYATFLLTVFIYTRVRGLVAGHAGSEAYNIMDYLERGLNPNISAQTYHQVKLRLIEIAAKSSDPNTARLAGNVLYFLEAKVSPSSSNQEFWLERWKARFTAIEARWVTQSRLKIALTLGLIGLGLRGLATTVAVIFIVSRISDPAGWQQLVSTPWTGGQVLGPSRLYLVIFSLILESVIGSLLLIGAGLLLIRHLRQGLTFGYWGLLFSLTSVQLLLYYFNQFDIIGTTVLQFSLLLGIVRFRARYLNS